ncbi:hypothetical protein DXB21_13770 [Bacteroides faecis]|uniref:glucosaminidase domain-containing protein n=1 Tax=Bacteroides faecis TaxID=674529 RepID=UPI000E43E46B|nr:glucosaminidase domain-containing protein [Bacteroides faecis]MCS2481050.1 hypothetical protein [Bacteroides faecis]RGO31262.1 hypothetical protein DXB21_13770 [Bacteroides faecis]
MVLRIEDISFIGVYINDSFRDFKDINDYANYHVSLLNNKRYNAFNGGDFIDSVVKGGYATDPKYKKALSNVYNQIAKGQKGLIVQAVNKVKSILPKEKPKEPINVVDVAKEYAPSAVASMLLGNVNPIIGQILGLNQNIDLTKAPPSLEKVNTNMWKFENPKNKGLRGNLYYPFKTANGNTDIGPGYDLDMQTAEFKKKAANGMTKEELDAIMLERLRKEIPHLDAKLNSVTNNNADTISPQIKEGLLDMYWQLKNGLYDYDNLFEGIAKGDIDKIREESKVTYKSKNTGKRYFDSGRYKHRIDNYFHY